MRRAMLKTPKIRCRTYLQLGIFELTREPSTKSAGLVVKGGDSYSEDCEFKSRRHILDGYFYIDLLFNCDV